MGISGLLPFLEKSSNKININQFSGGTVAIDAYCWLHKGVFSCADKLLMGQSTDAYVRYCMKFVNMLLKFRIKPILVFDGRHLPAKAATEAKRKESRGNNRRKAAELIRTGQVLEGKSLLRRAIDVTHEMALEVIKQCQKLNIDCIVAPYEADAQLAYLNISGIADVIITEDSDLTLFGCKKVFFKMDQNGYGLLIVQDKLHLAMGTTAECFDYEKFRYMCILSGCDYLPSLPGIGLSKAKKFVNMNADSDIYKALTRLGSYLNMKSLVVSKEYRDAFLKALTTFKHQLVFCPVQRKQVRLTPPTPDITEDQLNYAGKEVDSNLALQLALGNCDPFTFKKLHAFDPDSLKDQNDMTNSSAENISSKQISIWSLCYKTPEILNSISVRMPSNIAEQNNTLATTSVSGTVLLNTPDNVNRISKLESDELSSENILKPYTCNSIQNIERFSQENAMHSAEEHSSYTVRSTSPVINQRKNPFAIQSGDKTTSPNILMKGRSRSRIKNLVRFKKTVFDDNNITESKFFTKPAETNDDKICEYSHHYAQLEEHVKYIDSENTDVSNFIDFSKEKQICEKSIHETDVDMNKLSLVSDQNVYTCQIDVDKKYYFTQPVVIHVKAEQQLQNKMITSKYLKQIQPSLVDDKKKYLHVCDQITNMISNAEKGCINHEDKRSGYLDTEDDYVDRNENISNLRNDLVTYANSKLVQKLNESEKNYKKRSSSNTDMIFTQNNGILKRTRCDSNISVEGRSQQSLLSMYGFKKKSTLKH